VRLVKDEVVQNSVESAYAEAITETEEEVRKTGIDVIGDAPWGTHFCQFYETKKDLIDVLVPYFKAGLENNEFCMWVTSEPLNKEEATEAMRRAVANFDRYLERGQIEIVPHTEWYLKGGAFNLKRVLNAWVDKLNQALAKGYNGIRVTGNTAWLEKRDWKEFADYEEEVNSVIGKYRMMAICTYSLDKCGASEVIDVVRNHQFALIRRRGRWELIESFERKRVEEVLRRSEAKFRNIFESASDYMVLLDRFGRILDVNQRAVEVFGGSKEELLGKHFTRVGVLSPREIPTIMSAFAKALVGKKTTYYTCIKNKKGQEIHVEVSGSLLKIDDRFAGLLVIARDVTERRKAEEELIRLSSAVKMSTDSIVISDMNAKIIDVNEATLKMYGTDDKGDLIGKNSFDLIVPEDREKALAGMKEALEKGYLKSREHHIIIKNGGRIPVEMSAAIMKDADGKPIGFVGISRDISERKRAEEALRESEERLRQLIEYAPDAIYMNDLKGNFIDGNKQAEVLTGYKKDELIGKSMLKVGLLPKRYVPKAAKALMKNLLGQKTGPDEFELKRKDGSLVTVEISTFPVKRGGKVEVIGIARDITERKQMQKKLEEYSEHLEELVQKRTEELLESEKRYSVLVEEASDRVVIIQDGKNVFTNKKALEIVGYSSDELADLPPEKLIDEKYLSSVKEGYVQLIRGKIVPSPSEVELITKTGERVPVEGSPALVYYQGRPAVLVIWRDIRERKRMEEERLRLEKLAAIGELATMVGHDLRNPLQSIENATYVLKDVLSECAYQHSLSIPQKAMEMFQVVTDSAEYADKIIRDLQDFAASRKPILKKIDINAVLTETLSQVKAPENVKLITELSHLPEIKVDKDMIKRVFMNLALNGIQAMENEGTLKVSTKKTNGFVEVSFKDTGKGIPKENREKLFTPFFTTKAKGMGMGLPICKKFVDANGGTIEVESEEGKGSTFTVKLPIQPENGGEKT